MTAQNGKTKGKKRWLALRRHRRAARIEQSGVDLMSFVRPMVGIIAIAILTWGIGQGFTRRPQRIDIDYSQLFLGEAKELPDGKVEIFYDFAPRPDGFVDYPQLQDWSYDKGVYKGWLFGQASLRTAFTKEVNLEFDFKLVRGNNIMPAVGVRSRGKTRLAVLIEKEGRISVWKFLKGLPLRVHETQTSLSFAGGQEHHVSIKAVTIHPPEGAEIEPEDARLHPEELVPAASSGRYPEEELNHTESSVLSPPPPAPEPPLPKEPPPYTELVVSVDGEELTKCRVRRYVIDGWVMLDAWNSSVLFNNIKITGRLHPAWLASEILIRRKITAIKKQ